MWKKLEPEMGIAQGKPRNFVQGRCLMSLMCLRVCSTLCKGLQQRLLLEPAYVIAQHQYHSLLYHGSKATWSQLAGERQTTCHLQIPAITCLLDATAGRVWRSTLSRNAPWRISRANQGIWNLDRIPCIHRLFTQTRVHISLCSESEVFRVEVQF